ncbi:unnamed protein product [Protopolystoma xenopodis]|uniref:Uncharacterized protein n=1 Tax=Protopolystoma xenopodis TaxID=117903 RepID=A0A3S5FC33_9PLAT|nr:unnamed protein product [Protopolystoma xenopodis]
MDLSISALKDHYANIEFSVKKSHLHICLYNADENVGSGTPEGLSSCHIVSPAVSRGNGGGCLTDLSSSSPGGVASTRLNVAPVGNVSGGTAVGGSGSLTGGGLSVLSTRRTRRGPTGAGRRTSGSFSQSGAMMMMTGVMGGLNFQLPQLDSIQRSQKILDMRLQNLQVCIP